MNDRDIANNAIFQAQMWKQEDAGHKASLFKCYKRVGAQKGDWNGAKPVIEYIDKLEAEVKKLESEMRLLLGAMLAAENALREAKRRHEDFRGSEKQP